MQALHSYIVEIDKPYSDTITTKGGQKLYINTKHSITTAANRKGVVVSQPALGDPKVAVGTEIIMDITVLMRQGYIKGGYQKSPNLADEAKNWYYVDPNLLLMYKVGEEWLCHENHLFVKPIPFEKKEKYKGLIDLSDEQTTYEKCRAEVVFVNEFLKYNDIKPGDILVIKEERDIAYEIDGETYWWIRNHDVLGLLEKQKN
ncbi:MAG: hypothetical protein ACWA5P_01945 [bacterium]